MGFGQSIRSAFDNYANFQGRASRPEYWYFVLFLCIGQLIAVLVDRLLGYPIVIVVFALATLVPSLSTLVRRLHDTGRSGWYYFIILIPVGGAILLIYWLCQAGDAHANPYGDGASEAGVAGAAPPSAGRRGARLVVTFERQVLEVGTDQPRLRIGRSSSNDLVVSDLRASGKHALIEYRSDRFFLTDHSSNGTHVRMRGGAETAIVGKEITLREAGLIGLGRSTETHPELCIRFEIMA